MNKLTEKFYPREHDLLKLYKGHYCPDDLKKIDRQTHEALKQLDIFKSLKHHCNIHYGWKGFPECSNPYKGGLRKEFILISLADWKASAISRRLRSVKHHLFYKVFKVWKDDKSDEKLREKKDIKEIIDSLKKGEDPNIVFDKNLAHLKRRSEDAKVCSFASLFVHSDLTEKWFNFFNDNNDYFGLPELISSTRDARRNIYDISGRKGVKKPIFFVRLKLNVNQKLARISDTKIINEVKNLMKKIPQAISGSQELYNLYDEILLVMRPNKIEDEIEEIKVKESLEKQLQSIDIFTTNYYLEGNILKTYLSNKKFLHNFDELFGEYQHSFYPKLEEKIEITKEDLQSSDKDYVEAKLAMLCELCQLASATVTLPKKNYNPQTGEITKSNVSEHLCSSCANLRFEQEREEKPTGVSNEEKGGKIGRNIARWEFEAEEKKKDIKLCFIKISLNMKELVLVLKERFQEEFEIDDIGDEDLGFSIVQEFLSDYKQFVDEYREKIFESYEEDKRINILPNFFCLKMEKEEGNKRGKKIKDIVDQFITLYQQNFPKFKKEKSPIEFSLTYSNIKYPFTEHWRYLTYRAKHSLNIFAVRKSLLEIEIDKYHKLSQMRIDSKRVSSFLHNLAKIEERTGNRLLLEIEVIRRRKDLGDEIFWPFTQRQINVSEILSYYKIFGEV